MLPTGVPPSNTYVHKLFSQPGSSLTKISNARIPTTTNCILSASFCAPSTHQIVHQHTIVAQVPQFAAVQFHKTFQEIFQLTQNKKIRKTRECGRNILLLPTLIKEKDFLSNIFNMREWQRFGRERYRLCLTKFNHQFTNSFSTQSDDG